MEKIMDYEVVKSSYLTLGSAKFFDLFNSIYKEFDLYSMSMDWIKNKEYVLKFKGSKGDIIIGWK